MVGLFLFQFLSLTSAVFCDEFEGKLLTDLLYTYDNRIRPSINHTKAVNVTFGLALSQIIDLDEKNQILTTNCWINQQWIDYRLQWDPDQYDGITVTRIGIEAVWLPDIYLYNNANILSRLGMLSSNVILQSDGNVTWLSMAILQSSCSIDVEYWPFDVQTCRMDFASWTYDGAQLNLLIHGTDDGDASNFMENSEWELVSFKQQRTIKQFSCCPEVYPIVSCFVVMRRRPLFYIYNLMFPCVLISLIALLGFYVPAQSGEKVLKYTKVTLGITTLLSMTVFLMTFADSLPPTKNQLPLLGLYYGIIIAIVSLTTWMTVFTLSVHHNGSRNREVPFLVRRITFFLAKIVFLGESVRKLEMKRKMLLEQQQASSFFSPDTDSHQYKASRERDYRRGDTAYVGRHHHNWSVRELHRAIVSQNSIAPVTRSPHSRQMEQDTSFSIENGDAGGGTRVKIGDNLVKIVSESIKHSEKRRMEKEWVEFIQEEWHLLSVVLDRCLLVLFLVAMITVTCGLMLRVPAYLNAAHKEAEQDDKLDH